METVKFNEPDHTARRIAAQWQTSGTVGSVLAQLANTGEADKGELLEDMERTVNLDKQRGAVRGYPALDAEADMELLRELIEQEQRDQGVARFLVHERGYGVLFNSRPRTRIFTADNAEQCIAHCMASTPFVMGAPRAGQWHGYIGKPGSHASRPAVMVYCDTPRERRAMGVPQDAAAGVVLGTDGRAIMADGRDQAIAGRRI